VLEGTTFSRKKTSFTLLVTWFINDHSWNPSAPLFNSPSTGEPLPTWSSRVHLLEINDVPVGLQDLTIDKLYIYFHNFWHYPASRFYANFEKFPKLVLFPSSDKRGGWMELFWKAGNGRSRPSDYEIPRHKEAWGRERYAHAFLKSVLVPNEFIDCLPPPPPQK
jgi:hypothetical protein